MDRNIADGELVTRRASAANLPDVLALLRRTLGWSDADVRYLEWKHLQNPFGQSPMWIALAGSRVVGFRAFLRWELVGADGRVVLAARAVDTATDPDFQGRGIFTRLTLAGLDALAGDGVELVFNTPNRASLAGYLKMGWHEVGQLPAAVRPARWRFAVVVATARKPAGRASVPGSIGVPAAVGLADSVAVERLLDQLPSAFRSGTAPAFRSGTEPAFRSGTEPAFRSGTEPASGLTTRRTPAYLAWRYGNPDLGYRALLAGSSAEDGLLLFRLRRRGKAIEAVVAELMVPDGARRARGLLDRLARSREADYLIRLQDRFSVRARSRLFVRARSRRVTRDRFVRLSQVGPVLVCRSLVDAPVPDRSGWALSMGDVELL